MPHAPSPVAYEAAEIILRGAGADTGSVRLNGRIRGLLGEAHYRVRLAAGAIRRKRASRVAVAAAVSGARRVRLLAPGRPLTLRLANQYSGVREIPEIVFFGDEVARLSGGELRVRIVSGWTRPRDRDEERTLLTDLASGLADLGWAGTRAVGATFGLRALDPLQAPLLFPDYASVSRVCAELGDELLDLMRPTGLVGLAVLPGEMRRAFGITRPLVAARDWRGAVIRTHASLVGEATFSALGAVPVLRHARELAGPEPAGIDGMDLHAGAIAGWGYRGQLTWNVRLWPRTLLLAANPRSLARLGRAGQEILREAAARAVAKTAADFESGEERDARAVPAATRLLTASTEELAELRDRLEPVYEQLRADPGARDTLPRIAGMAAQGY